MDSEHDAADVAVPQAPVQMVTGFFSAGHPLLNKWAALLACGHTTICDVLTTRPDQTAFLPCWDCWRAADDGGDKLEHGGGLA